MQRAGRFMDALTMHYYTLCVDSWDVPKGSATQFGRSDFYKALSRAARTDELITRHDAIMTRYDPQRRVGLIVDEWGAWYDVEPGTNPGFLYQQNTMRDALIAAVTLNIFNRHCDRVVMANLAQTVNVLQAVILTEGERMVLTPTYHVFDLYRPHQDAREVDCFVESDEVGEGAWRMGQVTASASERDGVLTVTLANLSADAPADVRIDGAGARAAQGRVLHGAMDAYNDFGDARLTPVPLAGLRVQDGVVTAQLPPCSVAAVRIERA